MKIPTMSVFLILAASAVTLFASPEADQQATNAAMKSYVIRVLQNHVTVMVVDGVATLIGTTETPEGKTMAGDTVSSIPGVDKVDNQIVVEPTIVEHSDAWIAAKIRLQLLVRANISLNIMSVDVKDGAVTLNGTVGTVAQRDMVGAIANNVEGVKSVQNQIGVRAPTDVSKPVIEETIDDGSITAQVKYALLTDHATNALKTKVTTNNGVVVITGEASSDTDRAHVTQLAGSIRGVVSVTNNMTVKS
jgi:hyperosmotically inducible protein